MNLSRFRLFLLVVVGLACLSSARANAPARPPLSPELEALGAASLLAPDAAAPGEVVFTDTTGNATRATFTALTGMGPGLAYRAENSARGRFSYSVEAKIKTRAAVKKQDVMLARFFARAPVARQESGEGSVVFSFQRGVAPHEKSIVVTATPGPEWTFFEIPFTSTLDFAAGEAVVALGFAELAQTVEICGLELLNFGDRARLEQLPRFRFTYRGREPDAPWRQAALARIEQLRTAPLAIRVKDSAGRAVAGARVEVRLIQPEFLWGTAVADTRIVSTDEEGARYRRQLLELFDTVVIENGLKWPAWSAGPERQAIARKALDWLDQQPLRLRGHNLVWPGMKFSPAFIKTNTALSTELPGLIEAHIRDLMDATRGRVVAWDVVNEPLHERDYFQHVPELTMVDWFKQARALDPEAQLFINEYSMLNSALSPGTIARYRELIQKLRRAGAPIDGIGIQGHIGQQPRAPELVLADLDLIAVEGLPVQITEFDINTRDEGLQADYTRDFLIACYSHPAMTGFLMWGFWEAQHWKPDAAMFRRDWSEKPNAAVWREWVLNKWKTSIDQTTAANGSAEARGHLGRYRLTVTHGGVVNRQDFVLTRAGTDLTVTFP